MASEFRKINVSWSAISMLFVVIIFLLLFFIVTNRPTIAYSGVSLHETFWIDLSFKMMERAGASNFNIIDLTPQTYNVNKKRISMLNWLDGGGDALVIGNANDNFIDVYQKAESNDVPVIGLGNVGMFYPTIDAYVIMDDFAAAKIAGEYILEQSGENGTLLIISGPIGDHASKERVAGLSSVLLDYGWEIIFKYTDWSSEVAFYDVANELDNGNLSSVFTCWDDAMLSIYPLIEQEGLRDEIVLVSFGGSDPILLKIQEEKVDAAIINSPDKYVISAIDIVSKLLNGEFVEKVKLIQGDLVVLDNVETFMD